MTRSIAISAMALALTSSMPVAAQQAAAGAASNRRVGQPPMNSAMRRANTGTTGPLTGSAAIAASSTATNAMTLTSGNGGSATDSMSNDPDGPEQVR